MGKNPNPKRKRYKISFVILLILMAVTFYIIFNEFEYNHIVNEITGSSHKFHLLFAGLLAVFYLMLYGRFIRISTKALGETTSHFKCFVYGCADFFYSAITPSSTGGQPAVIYFMAKDGLSYSTSAITVILQTISFKVVLLLYGGLSLFFIKDIILDSGALFQVLIFAGAALTVVMIAVCLVSMYFSRLTLFFGRAVISLLGRIHLVRNPDLRLKTFEKALFEYREAAFYIKGKRKLLLHLVVVTFLQRTAMFSIAFFVYRSFGLFEFGLIELLCLQAVIALAVDSIPLPGGIGANEYAMFFMYENIYGVDSILPAAAMLLTRGFSYYFTLIVSSIFSLSKQAVMHFGKKKAI